MRQWQKTEEELSVGPSRLNLNIAKTEDSSRKAELACYILNLIQPDAHDSLADDASFSNRLRFSSLRVFCHHPQRSGMLLHHCPRSGKGEEIGFGITFKHQEVIGDIPEE